MAQMYPPEWPSWEPGKKGEKKVYEALSRLDDSYYVFRTFA